MKKYEAIYRDLIPGLAGALHWAKSETPFCRDYGGEVFKQPRLIVEVTCEQDICHTLKVANLHKVPVAVRGTGHSCNQRTLTEGILLINHAPAQIQIDEKNLVMTPTRVTWKELEKKLNQHHLSSPVLTNVLTTTIGGTLSVGGCGMRSHRYGFQVDQVVKLKLILPSGESYWCSEDEHGELFRYSLAGLGSIGVIETAVLRTIPHQPFSRVLPQLVPFSFSVLGGVVDFFLERIEKERPDWAYLMIRRDLAGLEFGHESLDAHAGAEKDVHFRMDHLLEERAEERARNTNFCFDYILPSRVAQKFIDSLVPHFSQSVFEQLLSIYILSLKRPAYSPDIPLHPAPEKDRPYVGVFLLFSVPRSFPQGRRIIEKIQSLRHQLLHQCIELGGRPYLSGSWPLDQNMMLAVFGKSYRELQALRERLDPNKILSP